MANTRVLRRVLLSEFRRTEARIVAYGALEPTRRILEAQVLVDATLREDGAAFPRFASRIILYLARWYDERQDARYVEQDRGQPRRMNRLAVSIHPSPCAEAGRSMRRAVS